MNRTEYRATNPHTGEPVGPSFPVATAHEVHECCRRAEESFDVLRATSLRARSKALRAAASALGDDADEILALADTETALGLPRLRTELSRTCNQLLAFADMVEEGSFVDAMITPGDSTVSPPRPDLRRMLIPVGPVAVFGAGNFPLAFGVAGGDSASALSAGCPVVAKVHPGHPGTSERCALKLREALVSHGMPEHTIQWVHGPGASVGEMLVDAPEIAAVGFTGSQAAGRAIFNRAAARQSPIPVYAEMGSANPCVVTLAAIQSRGSEIAKQLIDSIALSAGQFCTKPGLIFVPQDSPFGNALVEGLLSQAVGPLLSQATLDTLRGALARVRVLGTVLERGAAATDTQAPIHPPVAFEVSADDFTSHPELAEELFGPAAVIVRYRSDASLLKALRSLPASLVAALYAEADEDLARSCSAVLSDRVGRLVFDAVPTGVSVSEAQMHGGPYPATTAPQHSSVGLTAVRRFLRPLAFQNAPEAMLPEALQSQNPTHILRKVTGRWTRNPVGSGRGSDAP